MELTNDQKIVLLDVFDGLLKDELSADTVRYMIKDIVGFYAEDKDVNELEESLSIKAEHDKLMSKVKSIANCADEYYRNLAAYRHKSLFGMRYLDPYVQIFVPGEVMILTARPGIGKTNLGLTMARNMVQSLEKHVLFFSLEMPAPSLFYRTAGIEISERESYSLGQDDILNILESRKLEVLKNVANRWDRVFFVDETFMTLEDIEKYVQCFRARIGEIGAIYIDYLGYLHDKEHGSLYEKISRLARSTKIFARKNQTRVILLCQSSRAGEDGTKEIELFHLRDSGAIEESADYLIGMWRDGASPTRLHCKILKGRMGGIGIKWDLIQSGLAYSQTDFAEQKAKKGDDL